MKYREWEERYVKNKGGPDLTQPQNDSNMAMEGEDMPSEYQRYGRNKGTQINNTYINSGEYRKKFDGITDNSSINRLLYSKAKEMLKHRSGPCLRICIGLMVLRAGLWQVP